MKAAVMDKVASSVKAVNLTKLKALKEYDAMHPMLPKANLTVAKPVLKLDFLKPNKTAVKVGVCVGKGGASLLCFCAPLSQTAALFAHDGTTTHARTKKNRWRLST
jgi:hypothetical protein